MKKLITLLLMSAVMTSFGQIKQVVYSNSSATLAEYNVLDVDMTADLGYLILSSSVNGGIAVSKLDMNGNIVWDYSATSGALVGEGTIQELSTGNVAVSYPNDTAHVRVLYINSGGTLIWAKQLTHNTETIVGNSSGVVVDESNPSFPIFNTFGSYGVSKKPFFVSLFNTGVITNQYSYDNFGFMMNDVKVTDMVLHSNGAFYAIAQAPYEKYLMRISSNGFLNMLKVMTPGLHLEAIEENSTGNLVAVGFLEDAFGARDVAFIEVDNTNMDLIDARTYGTSNNEEAVCVVQNLDNSYSIGVSDNSTGSTTSAIYKIDSGHMLEWARAYGGNGTDTPSRIYQKADGGWTLIGTTNSFSPSEDIHVVMTDDMGETEGCQEELGFVDETLNTIFVNPVVYSNVIPTISNTNAAVTIKTTIADTIIPFPTTTITANDPLCYGGTGSASLQVSGGVIPYTFEWSNGTSAQNLNNVFEGNYSVVVEDNNGCHVSDMTALTQPTEIITNTTNTDVSCAGASDGTVDLTVSGGAPGYTFQWTYNNETSEDLSNVPGGFYLVTVTDNNGCSEIEAVSVSEPSPLVAGVSSSSDPTCYDFCDGSLTSISTGGTAPYNYLWNDPSTQTTSNATGLCSGNYLLTVTDDNGCTTIASASLQNPEELTATITTTPSECGSSSGSGLAVPSGGTTPYNYNWPLGSTTDSESGIDVGSYTVDITDANGCMITESFDINSITNPVEICVVTVNDQNQNVVVWEKPVADNIEGFNIYRNIAGNYVQIGFNHYDSLSQYVDTDFGVNPDITSYRYKISVVDTCGNESILSLPHETIHLTVNVAVGSGINLIWDDYYGVAFTEYEIYRDTTGVGNWELIASVPETNSTYFDDLSSSNFTTVTYAVDIVLPSVCTSTAKSVSYNSSRSNNSSGAWQDEPGASIEESILDQAKVYPNPANSEFTIEINADEWEFELYDMSGRLVIAEYQLYDQQQKVDISSLERGVYLIRLSHNGVAIDKKIVIQ